MPPWLAPPGPPTIDLSSPSSIFSTRLDQDFSQTPHSHDLRLQENPNPNPNPNPSLGPTLPAYQPAPSPHMSATALLQKAAQMGATITKSGSMIRTHHQTHVPDPAPTSISSSGGNGNFGLNLSSRESAVVLLPNSASSAAASTSTSTIAAASSGVPPSSFLLHDVMSSFSASTSGFEGTSFEDAFGGIFNSKNNKDGNFHDYPLSKTPNAGRLGSGADDRGGGGNEGLTRDFLGLRPLSHNEIFSIAGIGNCMNHPSSLDQQNQSQKPW